MGKRLTIGTLAPGILVSSIVQWSGMLDAASANDADLICFIGSNLRDPVNVQANIAYELAARENVDGVICWSSMMGNYVSQEDLRAFHERYSPLPIVTLGTSIEGIPSVRMDSYPGMRAAVDHLIDVHGCRSPAFIRGPENHLQAQGRYQAYLDSLEAHGLGADPRLVTPPMNWVFRWSYTSGTEAMRILLDERRLKPHDDFDAVVAASDNLLIGAFDTLKARGIKVPEEVAAVGFDDIEQGQAYTPPFTTVAAPFYDIGYRSVELLLSMMEGNRVPPLTLVPSRLVIRQSCGCLEHAVTRVAIGPGKALAETPMDWESIPAAVARAVGEALHGALLGGGVSEGGGATRGSGALMSSGATRGSGATKGCGATMGWEKRLVEALRDELEGKSPERFMRELNGLLEETLLSGADVSAWQEAVSAMRRVGLPALDRAASSRAEDLWQQARVMIAEAARRQQMHLRMAEAQREGVVHEIVTALVTRFDVDGLMDALAQSLPHVGIPSCCLSLYENPQVYRYSEPVPEWSRLVLAYTREGRIALEPGGRRFLSRSLAPRGILPPDRRRGLVVEPLYFQANQIGFVVFEVGPRDGSVYETLAGQISSALQGTRLVRQEKRRALQQQTAAEVTRAVAGALGLDEVIHQTVELIRSRFDLHYVGLYLLDEEGRRAVLREGTGEAGRRLVRGGHALEVGGDSAVAWCIASRLTRVDQREGKEDAVGDAPLFPGTRSELTLPLVTRGMVVGAVTAQSADPMAFDSDVVTVLRTLVDHIAVAIQNARLLAAERERAKELEIAYGALKENQNKLLISEKMASLGRLTAGIAHEMNTPLAAVRAALSVLGKLVEEYRDSIGDAQVTEDELREIAEEMRLSLHSAGISAEKAAGFVQGIKAQTRDLDSKERRLFNAVEVIRETLSLLGHAFRSAKCTAVFEPSRETVEILGSTGRLAQVVTSLVMNGIEASAAGGGGPITVSLEVEPETVVLQVSDHGCGIAPENLGKIYDAMFTTKPFGEGTGLGLTIVHDLVTGDFQGSIDVESLVGSGTTFTIRFPNPKGKAAIS